MLVKSTSDINVREMNERQELISNSRKVTESNLQRVFKKVDKIYFHEVENCDPGERRDSHVRVRANSIDDMKQKLSELIDERLGQFNTCREWSMCTEIHESLEGYNAKEFKVWSTSDDSRKKSIIASTTRYSAYMMIQVYYLNVMISSRIYL